MNEWLSPALEEFSPDVATLAYRLAVSLVFGAAVALAYRASHGRDNPQSLSFCTTLILLSALIAMVSIVIGGNVARAFSLVGALSIVRFRTVVEDTRDTAFVIFAVIVGMAAGTGHILLPLISIPPVGLVAIALNWLGAGKGGLAHKSTYEATIRMGIGGDGGTAVRDQLQAWFEKVELISAETTKQGAAIDYEYALRGDRTGGIHDAVAQLNRLSGVQGARIKRTGKD